MLAIAAISFSCEEKLSNDQIFEKYYISPLDKEKGLYSANPENKLVDKLYFEAHESINSVSGYSSKLFERLSLDNNDVYKEEADWFLSLSLIKEGRIEEAMERLNQILKFKYHKYSKESKEVLKHLI